MSDLYLLVGYGAVWDTLSAPMRRGAPETFRERILPTAFDASLRPRVNVFARRDHDCHRRVADRESGTVRLLPNAYGLWIEVDPSDYLSGDLLVESVQEGRECGLSVGMNAEDDIKERTSSGVIRTVRRARLVEVSFVTSPAYPSARVKAVPVTPEKLRIWREVARAEFEGVRTRDVVRKSLLLDGIPV